MTQTKGQIRALDILARIEAGEPRADIAASYSVSESSIYFETRFGKFLRYRAAHPDDKKDIGAWGSFDVLWGKTDKTQKSEETRFAQLIDALPLATDVPTKADRRSKAIADVEAAKPPRKNARKGKIPANGCDWPLATEAAAIIAAKAAPAPEPEPVAASANGGFTADALAALAEPIADPTPTPAPAKDPVVAKREAKTIAQRLRRAAAKAAVQWKGNSELTAAAE